jgi:glycosyltransferase involved in cell wall biosynthesis
MPQQPEEAGRPATSPRLRVAMLLHKDVTHDSRVRREASHLAAQGHAVTVLELAPVAPERRTLDGFARRSVLPAPWVRRTLPAALYRLAFFASFVRAICAQRPDIVHAHDAAMLLPGLVGARVVGARLVYDSHELATSVPYRDRAWAWFVANIERLGIRRAAAIITVSDGIADELVARYRLRRRPTVLRNVSALVEGPVTSGGGLRDHLDAAASVVLHQGAPAVDRGCEALIEALCHLPPEVHVIFLGSGEPAFTAELVEHAQRLGVADRMRLLDSVGLGELIGWTREADVGVALLQDTCLNHRLALPNKLFEYIAAGVPVVVSDLPELRRIVNHYNIGWTATPDDPRAIAQAISRALDEQDDPRLRENLERAASELRWSQESRRLTNVYELLAD